MKEDPHKDEALSPEEKAKLAALNREQMPQPSLEENIVKKLKTRGLISPPTLQSLWTLPRAAAAIAAAIFLFVIGFTAGQLRVEAPVHQHSPEAKALFVLFLYDSEQQKQMDEMSMVAEYGNWIRGVAENGRVAGGEKLKDGGKILSSGQQQLKISDLNTDNAFGSISGYFLIEAKNYDEALKIAATCPHLKYNGKIELREIDRL